MNKKIFVSIELIFYMLFLYLDLTSRSAGLSNLIKYSGIILCFFYAIFLSQDQKNKRELWCVRIGLFFTVLADYVLIFKDHYLIGVVFFVIVQTVYLLRFYRGICFGLQFAINSFLACVVCLIAGFIHIPIDLLLCISCIYFVSLVHNVFIAIRKGNKRTAIGMVLFLLCDINVAMMNANSYIVADSEIIGKITAIATLMVWIFYLPSQVLHAMSVEENRR